VDLDGSADLGGGRLALDHRVIDVVESILVRERVWPLELREGQLLLLMLLLHLLQEKQHGQRGVLLELLLVLADWASRRGPRSVAGMAPPAGQPVTFSVKCVQKNHSYHCDEDREEGHSGGGGVNFEEVGPRTILDKRLDVVRLLGCLDLRVGASHLDFVLFLCVFVLFLAFCVVQFLLKGRVAPDSLNLRKGRAESKKVLLGETGAVSRARLLGEAGRPARRHRRGENRGNRTSSGLRRGVKFRHVVRPEMNSVPSQKLPFH